MREAENLKTISNLITIQKSPARQKMMNGKIQKRVYCDIDFDFIIVPLVYPISSQTFLSGVCFCFSTYFVGDKF